MFFLYIFFLTDRINRTRVLLDLQYQQLQTEMKYETERHNIRLKIVQELIKIVRGEQESNRDLGASIEDALKVADAAAAETASSNLPENEPKTS